MKWNHHIPLILELEPIRGFYIPECTLNELKSPKRSKYLFKLPNKGYRNLAYIINSWITNSTQTVVDKDGNSKTWYPGDLSFMRLNIGSSSNPHDVTRYELFNRRFGTGPLGFFWPVEATDKTSFMSYVKYMFPPPDQAVGEVGLYWFGSQNNVWPTVMVARVIIDPAVTKYANTLYEEGWQIDFPANYTRWFVNLPLNLIWYNSSEIGFPFRDVNGNQYLTRQGNPWSGSPDVMIGSDNTPPSPTDYNLKSPIASLANQTHVIEIDTSIQECRIVRYGTYTPSTNVTLGEIALFTNIYDTSGTVRKIMVARGVWETPVTLVAGTTYTIGIALKMG